MFHPGFDVPEQLVVVLAQGVYFDGLVDGQERVVVVLLDEEAHRKVVVGLVVMVVQLQGLFVVVNGLLVNRNREIGVSQVFVEVVLLTISQAPFEEDDGFRVSAKDVQSCTFIVVKYQGHLLRLTAIFNLLQEAVAQFQTVSWPLQVQIDK